MIISANYYNLRLASPVALLSAKHNKTADVVLRHVEKLLLRLGDDSVFEPISRPKIRRFNKDWSKNISLRPSAGLLADDPLDDLDVDLDDALED